MPGYIELFNLGKTYETSKGDHVVVEGFTLNVPMPAGMGDREYLRIFRDVLVPVGLQYRPELILVSAGFDAHREDPLAGLKLSEADFAWVTRELIGVAKRHGKGRVVSSLEGGYSLSALGRSATEHLREFVEA